MIFYIYIPTDPSLCDLFFFSFFSSVIFSATLSQLFFPKTYQAVSYLIHLREVTQIKNFTLCIFSFIVIYLLSVSDLRKYLTQTPGNQDQCMAPWKTLIRPSQGLLKQDLRHLQTPRLEMELPAVRILLLFQSL